MNSTSAQSAFRELGYGEDELEQGLPKLEYLLRRDPELFKAVVEHCKNASPEEAELWREWFATYPAKTYDKEDASEGHLEMFRMRYHLSEIAMKLSLMVTNGSHIVADTFIGSAWLYRERTGADWDATNAFNIVLTLMTPISTTASSTTPEAIAKIRYVGKHLREVVELLPEIHDQKITDLERLQKLVNERFPHTQEPEQEDHTNDDEPTEGDPEGATLNS